MTLGRAQPTIAPEDPPAPRSTNALSTSSPTPAPRRRGRVLGLLAGFSLLAAVPACDPDGEHPISDLRVLYTATLNGYLEPCGCVVGKTGGIDRIAARLAEHRSQHPNVLFLDGGDLIAQDPDPGAMLTQQLVLKADALLEVWSALGCRAMALGDLDLVIGVEELQRLSGQHGVPVLCANLEGPDGRRPFDSWIVLDQGDLKVGVFSLLGPELDAAGPKDQRIFDVAGTLRDMGLRLTDWRAEAERVVSELRPQVDVLIALTHLGAHRNAELAERHPEIDLISGGHEDTVEQPLRFIDGVPVTTSTIRGGRLNRIDMWLRDPAANGRGRREWNDVSANVWPEVEIGTVLRGEQMIAGREVTLGTEEWGSRITGLASAKRAVLAVLREPMDWPRGDLISAVGEPLPMSAVRSELALEVIDDYHDRIHDLWLGREGEGRHPTESFVGPAACYECHEEQYEFWRSTAHSRAFATLEATRQHMDVECNGCHTVGFQAAGGFRFPNRHQGFENVQCAACHGPGGPHTAGGASYLEPANLFPAPDQTCFACHNEEHAPRFANEYAEALPIVSCPPMGMGTDALNRTRLIAAEALGAREEFDRELQCAVFMRAGAHARALESAEAWVAAEPQSIPARLVLGEIALLLGDAVRAGEMARGVTPRRPNMVRAWKLSAAAALGRGDLALALRSVQEASSLAPADPEVAVLVARVAQAGGELEGAIDALRVFMQLNPGAAAQVESVLEELLDARR